MKKLLAVLVDLSGTLHVGDSATDRALEALCKLRSTNLKLRFVTNTTKEGAADLKKRLDRIGFEISPDEIFGSLSAARQLIERRQYRPLLLLQPSARLQFAGVEQSNPNAVVVGLAPDCFNYSHLNKAFRLLLEGACLIAVHEGRYYKEEDGLSLGPGAFVKGLEYATGVTAEVVGKPQKSFFEAALANVGCAADEAVMIGDDVIDDVRGAQEAGIQGVLVKTGKYRKGDEDKINPRPHHVADCFADAVEWILDNYA